MAREYYGIRLTGSFEDSAEGRARAKMVLKHYFRPLAGKNIGYTGGAWDTFDPSGIRRTTTNEYTAEDLVACALLSTAIPGRAAVELLDSQSAEFKKLLTAIGEDRPFVDVDDPTAFEFDPVRDLHQALDALPGVGMTRAIKLIGRKRPQLVPIVDGVIHRAIFSGSGPHWKPLHTAFTAEACALWRQLLDLKREAELPDEVPVVRVFDVLAWMDGTGKVRHALQQ